MAWFITHSLIVIVLAALLGLLVGWLLWGRIWPSLATGQSESGAKLTSEATPATADSHAVDDASGGPMLIEAHPHSADGSAGDQGAALGHTQPDEPTPTLDPPDNLQRIEGVGPRIAAALEAGGIRTFGDLAAADADSIAAALRSAGLAFARSASTWPRQAALLLDGDEAGLAALKTQLVPERDLATAGGTPAEGIDVEESPASEAPSETDSEAASDREPSLREAELAETGLAETELAETELAEPDDLERIEGIGPRIAAALRTAGLGTFQSVADAESPTLQAALEAAGLRFAPSLPTWARQATLLAAGDHEGHAALSASLVAGRDPERTHS